MRLIIYDWLLVSVTNLCNQLVITQNKFLLSREHDIFLICSLVGGNFKVHFLKYLQQTSGYILVKLWCGVSSSVSVNVVRINVAFLSK